MKKFSGAMRIKSGFTIIEMVVVISVVGILATITVVGYGSWRHSAMTTSVKSDLNGVIAAMENARMFNNGYPTTLPSTFTASENVSLSMYAGGTTTTYCVDGVSTEDATIAYYAYSETKDQGAQEGACDTLILPEEPIAVVQRGWYQQVLGTGNPSVLDATAANAETGDLMIAAFCITSTSGTIATPSGWTQIVARTAMGTRGVQIFAKIRQSSDGDSYSFTVSTAFARRGVLIALGNTGPVSSLVIGSLGLRSVNGTSYTNVAPSITTTADNTYILTISAEATTTDDTVAPSVTAGGATFLLWSDDADTLETIMAAYLNQTSAGTTSAVTITYQNTQTSNGAALQIGIPPYDAIQS